MLKSETFFHWLGIFIGITLILKVTQSFLIPPTFAIMLAFMTLPVYRFMMHRKVPPFLAIMILMILLSFLLYLIFMVLQASLSSILRSIPKYQETLKDFSRFIFDHYNFSMDEGFLFHVGKLTESIYNVLLSFPSRFLSLVSSAVVVLLFYIFLMSEIVLFGRKFSHAYTDSYEKIVDVLKDIGSQIGYYLAIKFLISLMTGVITTLLLLVLGADFAFVWGVLAFILNFIPNVGSILVVFLISLFSFLQFFPDFTTPFLILGGASLIQIIMGNILEPKLQGDQLDISPFLLLFFFFFWGWLWGITGMFFAYPLTVILKVTFQNIPALKPFAILLGSGRRLSEVTESDN